MVNGPVLAFVLPWYGPDVIGGAELLARHTAERLAAKGVPVEVLTTCARDQFSGWFTDVHKPGTAVENGVMVRRFPLRARRCANSENVNRRLIAGEAVSAEDERCLLDDLVNSDALYAYIAREQSRYVYCFLPYFFGTTYHGALAAPERSYLIPCLHDEGYARMALIGDVFRAVRGVVLLSTPEGDLVHELYSVPEDRLHVFGAGVDTDSVGDAARFRRRYGIREPFLLFVGRQVATKNAPLLLEYFFRYHYRRQRPLKLVLIGPGSLPVPERIAGNVISLGQVSEQDKLDAYAAAVATVQPSVRESFSFVLMESWLQRTPVLVNADCAVTRHHAIESGGGLAFHGFAEFAGCLDYLCDNREMRDRLGASGREYVLRNFAWERVLPRYQALLDSFGG